MRPRGTLTLPVKVAGLQPGEEARITVAAVDVGILNLTRYQAPDPGEHFFGQKQLGTEIRDLYGYLIDGMQGTRGAIRSGGDAGGLHRGHAADAGAARPLLGRGHGRAGRQRRRSPSTSRPSTARCG